MDVVVSAVLAVGFAYLCEHPGKVAGWGLNAHLHKRVALEWMCRQAYRSLFSVYCMVHGRSASTPEDLIVRFGWFEHLRDAATLQRVAEVVHIIEERQQTAVELDNSTELLFLEMRQMALDSDIADWHDLGFQGKNPATDFRGAGRLGFDNLYDFCTMQTETCQTVLSESNTSIKEAAAQPWYPLALVSIRLSMALAELLKRDRMLVVHLLNSSNAAGGKIKNEGWELVLRQVHHSMILSFHGAWLDATASGKVKTYFDNEIVLKDFEASLPKLVYTLIRSTSVADLS